MQKYLYSLKKELDFFKENHIKDKEISVNLEKEMITDINLLYTALYAANRQLDGAFTTLNSIKEKNFNVLPFAESIPYISYTFNTHTLFFKNDLLRIIPEIDLDNTDAYFELIKNHLKKYSLSGFNPKSIKGDNHTIELAIPHIAYIKKEIVPNEYITNTIDSSITITSKNISINQNSNHNTENILTDFFANMYVNGSASIENLKNISIENNILQISFSAHQKATEIKESIQKTNIKYNI